MTRPCRSTNVVLYPYQRDAVKRMKNGCILCGGVGSGKSITSLVYFYERECFGKIDGGNVRSMAFPKDLYIITTARKRDSMEWDKECIPFHFSSRPKVNVTIDSWNNIKKYVDVQDAFFIFDEDRVTGSGAWVRSFYKITKKNHWILLSATPGDDWSDYIPVFVANGFYHSKTEFNNRHAVFSRYTNFPKIEKYLETSRLERLRDSILVDMDYSTPATQHHINVPVPYSHLYYKKVWKDRWNVFDNCPIDNPSQLCYILRKVTNSNEQRLIEVEKILDVHPKAIIFYNFDYELERLHMLDCPVAEWNGHKHEPIPDGERWAYLVQYTAGAEGWNCIKTDTVIFYSQNYSYKVMIQSAGRIDRVNTPFADLYFYHIRSAAPIDLAISRALARKKKFNERKFLGLD